MSAQVIPTTAGWTARTTPCRRDSSVGWSPRRSSSYPQAGIPGLADPAFREPLHSPTARDRLAPTASNGGSMAANWSMTGRYIKNCNCDPGCPCDFNQAPTQGNCEAILGMAIDEGSFNGVSLDGLHWACLLWWPGRMDEGN